MYFVNTALQFAKSLKRNILALLESDRSEVNRHTLCTQYFITLDKAPPLFKPRRESKKLQPENDTLPKTMLETYFSA